MSERKPDPGADAQAKSQRGWRFYMALVVIALALIFVIQNTEETNVSFLFAETEMPLFFALIAAIVLGALIGWLTPRVRRGGRSSSER
jgi:lipopolysaccharide assembly protein A